MSATDGVLTVEQNLRVLGGAVIRLQRDVLEIGGRILTADQTRHEVAQAYAEECGHLYALRDDAVKILNVLVDAGAVTREQLNAVIVPLPDIGAIETG